MTPYRRVVILANNFVRRITLPSLDLEFIIMGTASANAPPPPSKLIKGTPPPILELKKSIFFYCLVWMFISQGMFPENFKSKFEILSDLWPLDSRRVRRSREHARRMDSTPSIFLDGYLFCNLVM